AGTAGCRAGKRRRPRDRRRWILRKLNFESASLRGLEDLPGLDALFKRLEEDLGELPIGFELVEVVLEIGGQIFVTAPDVVGLRLKILEPLLEPRQLFRLLVARECRGIHLRNIVEQRLDLVDHRRAVIVARLKISTGPVVVVIAAAGRDRQHQDQQQRQDRSHVDTPSYPVQIRFVNFREVNSDGLYGSPPAPVYVTGPQKRSQLSFCRLSVPERPAMHGSMMEGARDHVLVPTTRPGRRVQPAERTGRAAAN